MRRVLLLTGFAGLLAMTALPAHAAGKTAVRLLLSKETVAPGETLLAAVQLKMAPRWHTYWRNAGDSGDRTKIEWQLPPGVTAGEIQWPPPEKLVSAGFTTYVYHDEVLLIVPLQLANTLAAGPLDLKAAVAWLECEELCVPGKASVQAKLTIGAASKPSADAPLIEAWQKKIPVQKPELAATASWERPAQDTLRPLLIEWSPGAEVKDADFFPYAAENYVVKGETEKVATTDGKIRLRKIVDKSEGGWPKEIMGLLVQKGQPTQAFEAKLAVVSAPAEAGTQADARPLLAMLGLAFLGGLILNIMPCVLPVIALKILSFVKQSKESPKRVAALGVTYSVGVLVSFLALASLIIGLKQAGHAANWGMQFQNTQFLVAMTILVTLVALNLFGLFEFNLGGSVMGAAGELTRKEGLPGAFFNGVLATALATPCTAPFLAPALGFAFAQPPLIILVVFLTIGLGLASPYLVLSLQPAWLKFLPKPGQWMQSFKVVMGFPMLATAVWMLTLTARHFGNDGVLWFGLFLVVLGLGAWIFGEFVQRGSSHRGIAMALAALLVGGFGVFVLSRSSDKIEWQRWSQAAVEKARAEGRPVFVDFTADWCLTCQGNKKTSIEITSVRAKLKEIGAVPLLGDYTREDDAITLELKRFSRAGVPLVLVYPKDTKQPPIVLPEVLTPAIVLEALEKAAGGAAKDSKGGITSVGK